MDRTAVLLVEVVWSILLALARVKERLESRIVLFSMMLELTGLVKMELLIMLEFAAALLFMRLCVILFFDNVLFHTALALIELPIQMSVAFVPLAIVRFESVMVLFSI